MNLIVYNVIIIVKKRGCIHFKFHNLASSSINTSFVEGIQYNCIPFSSKFYVTALWSWQFSGAEDAVFMRFSEKF